MTKAQLTQRNSELISEASSMEVILATRHREVEKLKAELKAQSKLYVETRDRNKRISALSAQKVAQLNAANALVKSTKMQFDEARISLDLAKGNLAYIKSLVKTLKESIEIHNAKSWISRIFSDGLI
jgi:hypothetical protein